MSRHLFRRLGIGLLALIVIAAGGYAVYWHRLAAIVAEGVPAWAAARQADGWAVAHGPVAVTGFPFDLRVAVSGPRVETPDGVAWSAPALAAKLSPLAPRRIHLLPAGRQDLLVPVAGRYRSFRLDAGAASGMLELSRQGPQAVTLHLTQVTASAEEAPPARVARLDVVFRLPTRFDTADYTTTTAALTVAARDIDLPAATATALGGHIAAFGLEARLQGVMATDRPLAEALTGWRDDGGIVEIERLALRWEPLDLEIDGTLALDAELQPLAAMTGKVRGYSETVDTFVGAGLVQPEDGRSVKLVLALMGRTPANGGPPVITVPLTIQDQQLLVGPVALLPVPRIVWPSTEIVIPEPPAASPDSALPPPPGTAGR